MGSRPFGVVFAALLLCGSISGQSMGEAVRPQAGGIVATYDAGLAGVSLGEFKVTANFAGSAYEMTAQGRFSLLAGLLYKGAGKTTSNGTINGEDPEPARYTLAYEDNKKSQQLHMTFARGAVTDVKIVPDKPHRRDVPVTDQQLKNVLDPLTAAFLSLRSNAPPGDLSVCDETIRVYDGRQRFDLVLSPKRAESLGGRELKGLPRPTAVCRVRYQPIAGYRPDHPGVQYMKENDKVEVWLVSVPGAGLYIPYKILVPTAWGTGTVELKSLKANLAAQRAGVP